MTLHVRSGGIYQTIGFNNLFQRESGIYEKVEELLVRDAGIYKQVWLADGPPPAPTGVTATVSNGGNITVSWAYPANGENDYNRVEVQQVGDIGRTNTAYPGTSQARSGYAHGASVTLQARTVDNGGQVSAWVNASTVTALSALPSPANVIAPMVWNGTSLVLQWTDPANPYGDISSVQVYYKLESEGSYTLFGTYGLAGGTRQVAMPRRAWDAVHLAKVRVTNSAGFTDSAFLGLWLPPAPGTEKTFAPHEANSWAYAAGGWRNDGTCRQGQFSATPMGNHFGCFFYGGNIYAGGHGYPAASGEIFMLRSGTQGFTGTVNFTGHGYQTNPGVAPTGSGPNWVSTNDFAGADAGYWESIPRSCLDSLASAESAGIGIFTFSTAQSNYRVFRGPSENAFAGMIRLRW